MDHNPPILPRLRQPQFAQPVHREGYFPAVIGFILIHFQRPDQQLPGYGRRGEVRRQMKQPRCQCVRLFLLIQSGVAHIKSSGDILNVVSGR